jgi:dipeptidyl aminopeptidase/acylaminoacyl peptidase
MARPILQLDNGKLREDSVKDIGALLDWIKPSSRSWMPIASAVFGGSYGGYMVLASMAHYNERLRAGIDIVGISDFGTFLKNTEEATAAICAAPNTAMNANPA